MKCNHGNIYSENVFMGDTCIICGFIEGAERLQQENARLNKLNEKLSKENIELKEINAKLRIKWNNKEPK